MTGAAHAMFSALRMVGVPERPMLTSSQAGGKGLSPGLRCFDCHHRPLSDGDTRQICQPR